MTTAPSVKPKPWFSAAAYASEAKVLQQMQISCQLT